jgi:hypothetical protein
MRQRHVIPLLVILSNVRPRSDRTQPKDPRFTLIVILSEVRPRSGRTQSKDLRSGGITLVPPAEAGSGTSNCTLARGLRPGLKKSPLPAAALYQGTTSSRAESTHLCPEPASAGGTTPPSKLPVKQRMRDQLRDNQQ